MGAGLCVLAIGLSLTGCPDPEAAARRFINDRPARPDMGVVSEGCTAAADRSGQWLMGVATVLDASRPLVFLATVTSPADGSTIDIDLQPLDAVTRTPVGDIWDPDPVDVAEDGTFLLPYGVVGAPGAANAITGTAIEVDFAFRGQIRSQGGLCGELLGDLIQPTAFDITGSTWATVAAAGELMGLVLATECPACGASDGPEPEPEGGPGCVEGDDPATRCMRSCAWLGDCAASDDFCPGVPAGDAPMVAVACEASCAANDLLGLLVCGHTRCGQSIDLASGASEDFALVCEEGPDAQGR